MSINSLSYNSINPFDDSTNAVLQTVGEDNEFVFYANRWANAQKITLGGVISGCNDYSGLIAAQNTLINNFSVDFKPLEIKQNGITIYSGNYGIIQGVNFQQSPYVSLVNWEIPILLYPEDQFSGFFGVLSPVDTFSYEQSDDNILSLSHSISCVGFTTSQPAIKNAQDFVFSRSGLNNIISPLLIGNCYNNPYLLQSIQENFNRIDGSYSLVENYSTDLANSGSGIVRYTFDLTSGYTDGINSITLAGQISMGKDIDIGHLRNRYKQLDLFNLTLAQYSGMTLLSDLQPYPLASGVVENETDKNLTFNVQFDNNPQPIVAVDATTNISYDSVSQITTVSINAEIFGRGDIKNRWINVLNYYENNFDGFNLANQDYLAAAGSLYPSSPFFALNTNPNTEQTNYDEFGGKITYSASWTNKTAIPYPFQDYTSTINVKPAINQFSPKPSLEINGYYSIFDLNFYNLEDVEFQGTANVLRANDISEGVSAAQNYVNGLIGTYAGNDKRIFENSLGQGGANDRFISWNVKFKDINPKFGNNNF